MKLALLKRKILNKGALLISLVKLRPLLARLNADSVVIDCGANIGEISQQFAKTGAQVYAFEPDPIAYAKLKDRLGETPNVDIRQQAVWIENIQLPFFLHEDRNDQEVELTVSSSLHAEKSNIRTQDALSVEAIDFVAFIHAIGKPIQLIKMDIEGAEVEVLNKIIETETYKKFDLAVVETHETKIPGHAEEIAKIKALLVQHNIDNIKLNWI